MSDNHKYHNTDEAAGLIEPLDERLAEFLKRLIRQGTKNAKELQRRALEYVKEYVFRRITSRCHQKETSSKSPEN